MLVLQWLILLLRLLLLPEPANVVIDAIAARGTRVARAARAPAAGAVRTDTEAIAATAARAFAAIESVSVSPRS